MFRDDDIVIATYAKAGTTWVQQMVAQMLLGPDPVPPRNVARVVRRNFSGMLQGQLALV